MPKISQKATIMPESPIRKLVPYAEAAKSKGRTVYHLNIGQPDIASPTAALQAIKNIDLKVIEYSHSAGFESYRNKLAVYYQKNNIKVRSFFAPNHIYDGNTLAALKNSGIKIIIDGYGLFPYYRDKILFVPQLFFKEILLPFGVQSTQVHMNNWDDPYCENFHKFINKNKKKITDLDHIIELANPHIIQKPVNYLVEKTLKTIRLFR